MMILNKIETTKFSPSEKEVIDYVLKHTDDLDDLSTQKIAEATYTSAPIVIRAAKKLGLSGWNELKLKLKAELAYLYARNNVDANIPFVPSDKYQDISRNISKLETETIADTKNLLTHDILYQAMSILRNKEIIDLYVYGQFVYPAHDFAYKLDLLDINVHTCIIGEDDLFRASKSNADHVAIIISNGQKESQTLDLIKRLHQKKTKIIGITSLEEDLLTDHVDCTLYIASREMRTNRIGEFASTTGAKLLLDILYGCIFSNNYDSNINQRITLLQESNHS